MPTDGRGGPDDSDGGGEQFEHHHDVESLRLAHREARTVLDHQIQTFADIDDKAAKTFRLDVILIGLLLTAGTFLTRADSLSVDPYINLLTVVSVFSLIASFVIAILTCSITGIETGVGPADVDRLIEHRYTETEWLILLLLGHAGWIAANERQNRAGARYLMMSHGALIVGVLCAFLGVLWVHLGV